MSMCGPNRCRLTADASQDASLVLVGGRAAGKTTIGLLASTFLRRPLVDSDKLYEKLYHCSIAESAAKEGMDTFREREEQMLRKLLEVYPRVRIHQYTLTTLFNTVHRIQSLCLVPGSSKETLTGVY